MTNALKWLSDRFSFWETLTLDDATMWLTRLGYIDDALWLIEEVALGHEEDDTTPPLALMGWTFPAFFQSAGRHKGEVGFDAGTRPSTAEVRLPAPTRRGRTS